VRYRRGTLLIAISIAGLAAAHVAVLASASTSTASLSGARVVAHFDTNALQQPENITLEPGGAADVTFNRARDGSLYGNHNAGSQSAIWRVTPGCGTPAQVFTTPGVKVLNVLAAGWGQDRLSRTRTMFPPDR
jgi:hypothetical protein